MNQRLLNIDGVINFRDLGGYRGLDGQRVRWQRAYRSAQLDRFTHAGLASARELGVGTVVDLRFDDETNLYPTMRDAFPNAEFVSWRSELSGSQESDGHTVKRSWRDAVESGDPDAVREAMRLNYPMKLYSHQGVYRTLLLRLIGQDTPVLFHCAAGKDRTGVAAALILSLLGVSNEDIIQDYLVSQSQVSNLVNTWLGGGATGKEHYEDFQRKLTQYPREVVQPVFDADIEYITTLLAHVKETHHSFEQYAIDVLGLSDDQIASLRSQMLVSD